MATTHECMKAIEAETASIAPTKAAKVAVDLTAHSKAALATTGPRSPSALTTGYVLDIIKSKDAVEPDRMMRETLAAWTEHVNPGFLKYRKCVAEADGFAAIEWRDGEPGGATVLDAAGKEYIDLLGGFGIYACGHSHPVIVNAVRAQMEKQSLHSQELLDPLRAYCAALLAQKMPGDLKYSFFTNSGTESVEACLKFAIAATGRRHFIGVIGAFHGKTLGSLSATSKSTFRKPFANVLLPFTHVPVNDIDALKRAFESAKFTGNDVAAFIVEPVLGEGGIHICSDEYLRTARSLCDEYGSALIFDEVQSGMGRTGTWWACQHAGVAPDLMAIGKAFGGGVMAAGAAVGTAKMWAPFFENPFLFTTTFGGSPVAMAAAIAAMHVVESEGLVDAARVKGERILSELHALQRAHPRLIKSVRGRGLMIGLEFHSDDIGFAFSRGVFSRGILLSGTLVNSRVLRVEPPLTIKDEQITVVIARFAATLDAMEDEGLGVASPGPAAAVDTIGDVAVGSSSDGNASARISPVVAAGAALAGAGGGRPSRGMSMAEHADPMHREDHNLVAERGEDDDDDTEVSSVSDSSVESDESEAAALHPEEPVKGTAVAATTVLGK